MPELKNQHFVPKVHLRAFSDDAGSERRMINMIHVGSERPIKGASISGQCSKSYFYGRNLDLERAIGRTEGVYAQAVREVEDGASTDALVQSLRTMAYFQYLRTDSARKQFIQFHEEMNAAIDDPEWTNMPTNDELIDHAISTFLRTVDFISDLKCLIVQNRSATEFITSDAPAVVFNKWLSQKQGIDTFGLMSSGFCLYMPLGPRYGVLAFDSKVYEVDQTAGRRLVIKDGSEIELLNALLMRADASNVYFRNWESREKVLAEVIVQKPFRTPACRVNVLVLVEGSESTYRALADGEDPRAFQKTMLHSENLFPRPPKWFGFLKNKFRPISYENGTAAGFVRKREWLRSNEKYNPANARKASVLPGLPGNPFQ